MEHRHSRGDSVSSFSVGAGGAAPRDELVRAFGRLPTTAPGAPRYWADVQLRAAPRVDVPQRLELRPAGGARSRTPSPPPSDVAAPVTYRALDPMACAALRCAAVGCAAMRCGVMRCVAMRCDAMR